MDEFRKKVKTIEDSVDLARGLLATDNPFSYALQTTLGVSALDRADTWIETTRATDVLHELMCPPHTMEHFREVNRGLKSWQREERRLDQLRELKEMNEMDVEDRPEKLARLKESLERGLKSLREDIKPKVLHEDMSAWEHKEREQDIKELVDEFIIRMRKNKRATDEVLKTDKHPALRDYIQDKPPASREKWHEIVRDLIEVEAPVRRTFLHMEQELDKALQTCNELISVIARINPAEGEGRSRASGKPQKPGKPDKPDNE